MKHSLTFLSLLFFSIVLTTTGLAQEKKFEFNKITPADFSTAKYNDTTAEAVVIADVGSTKFEYGSEGFNLLFSRRTRIHILKPEGVDYATIEIPVYKSGSSEEKVGSFKGFTYNLENGEVVKTKVRNEDIFVEKESEHWNNQKIAFPAVKANSIIEFEYQIISDFFFNLQSWTFQSGIPVKWSEYNVLIPEYFEYKKISQGYIPFVINESTMTSQRFTVHVKTDRSLDNNYVASNSASYDEVFTPTATKSRWVAVDVPPMKPEPFTTTIKDYLSHIEFELSVIKMPETLPKNVMDSWETLDKKLLEDEDFGLMMKKANFISDRLPLITAKASTPVEKATAIFEHIRDRVTWNGEFGVFAESNAKKTYEESKGSVADINIMLVAVLREAGLMADPVILSTRNHGMITQMYPILAKFNYVIAMVRIDGTNYLLDATSRYTQFNTLPERCLNGSGRIISRSDGGWVQLLRSEMWNEYNNATLTLDSEGKLSGTNVKSSSGLSGNEQRNKFKKKELKDFIKGFSDEHASWTVNSFRYENLDSLDSPFVENYVLESTDAAQVAGDRIYLNGMANMGIHSNIFKLEKRMYPVDFSCPLKETNLIRIEIPEGWQVEELPKAVSYELPGKSGSFRYVAAPESGAIRIMSNLNITKTVFMPEEYEALKEFFRLITVKHAEQLILKKA